MVTESGVMENSEMSNTLITWAPYIVMLLVYIFMLRIGKIKNPLETAINRLAEEQKKTNELLETLIEKSK
jgi:hypothetical protein